MTGRETVGLSVALPWAGAGLVLLSIVATLVFPVANADTFWHLAYGRAMFAAGEILNREVLTYTNLGHPFNNHAWLAQLALFVVYQAGQHNALILYRVILVACAVLVSFLGARRLGAGRVVTVTLCWLAVWASLERLAVRPQLFSFLGLALLGFVLHGYRTGRAGRRALWWIPVIMVLWDCLHGAIQGWVFLAVFVVGETLKPMLAKVAGPRQAWTPLPRDRLIALWSAVGLTVVAELVSPYGLRAYGFFAGYLTGNPTVAMLAEWAPTPWTGMALFWSFLALVVVSLGLDWRRVDLTRVLLVVVFAVLAIRYRRAVAPFAFVAVPIAAIHLSGALERARGRLRWMLRVAGGIAVCACLATTVLVKWVVKPEPGDRMFDYTYGWGLNAVNFPVGSTRFIKELNVQGNMYNTDALAGYLAFHLGPERKIFHFLHHMLPNVMDAAVHTAGARAKWNISYAVVAREIEQNMFIREGFVPVYREPLGVVLLRSTPSNAALIERYRVRYFDPFDPERRLRALASHEGVYPRLMQELADHLTFRRDERLAAVLGKLIAEPRPGLVPDRRVALVGSALRQNGDSPLLLGTMGALLYQSGQPGPARAKLGAALALDPTLKDARANLAFISYDRGEYAEAAREFERVLADDPRFAYALYGLGLVKVRTGQLDEARNVLHRFLKIVPRGRWADKARELLRQHGPSPGRGPP